MSENASGEYENITVCEACECDEGVNLVVSVDTMLSTAFFISLIMITLTGIHFLLKLLRDCAKHPDTEPYSWFIGVPDEAQQRTRSPAKLSASGVVVEGEVVKAEEDRGNQFQLQLRKVVRKNFMPQDSEGRQLHFFMVAKCEGQGFFNFCVLSVLEAVLSVTATANTSLEGDFEFVNDPGHVTETVAWLLTIANLLLLFFFVGEYRRTKGMTRYWCLLPQKGSTKHLKDISETWASLTEDSEFARGEPRRLRLIELFTWLSLIISMFQVVVGAVATASQVASGGYRRTAILINTIEVGSLMAAKLYSLYNWHETWKEYARAGKVKGWFGGGGSSAAQLQQSQGAAVGDVELNANDAP